MILRDPARLARFCLLGWLVTLYGCGSGPGRGRVEARPGPMLLPVGDVLLEESDSAYIGKPFSLVVDADGSFFISDFFSNSVYHFARDGALVSTIGRPGGGPGEFQSVSLVFVANDSTLVAADSRQRLLTLFDRRDGSVRAQVRYRGVLGNSTPAVRRDTAWIPSRALAGGTSVLAWDMRRNELRYFGPLPAEYMASARGLGRYASFNPYGALAHWADTLLVGMSGRNELILMDDRGVVLDTIDVPVARRRGVPPDILEVFGDVKASAQEIFKAQSALVALHRLPGGNFSLVHHDSHLEGELPGGLITVDAYVSVLSADRRRACVDAVLPTSPDARPIQTFRGDTLFLLDRRITSEERLETRIRMFRIDTTSCGWIPTAGGV